MAYRTLSLHSQENKMINNFSHIGFISSKSDYKQSIAKLLELVRQKVSYKQYGDLKHLDFNDNSGAGIHIVVDKNDSLVSLDPYFVGNSEIKGKLERIVFDELHHEGGFVMECVEIDIRFPIYFSSKNIIKEKEIGLPQIKKVQLTGFPREIKFFDSITDPEFINTQLSEKAIIPSGLFLDENNKPEKPEAVISGRIVKVEEHVNKLSNLKFLSIVIETLGGQIDIVLDPKIINSIPKKGKIVAGQFWISGRILD
jgi:hypothetical protein